uniref:THUMP domain-containing protein n=1 Tax=Oryza barthii TaxID=65489 RepID=A0A0D3F8R8_9ORYZ
MAAAAEEPEPKPEIETPPPAREPPTEPPAAAPAPAAAASDRPLQPWEQHAAVINLPRYDYRASGSLLLRSHSGFLITCPIKREKSATKEAISILENSIGHANSYSSEKSEPSDTEVSAKKRKICSETPDIENSGDAVTYEKGDASETTGSVEKDSVSPHSKTSKNVDDTSNLSLVKLSRSGLLFFSFPSGGLCVVQMLTQMFHSLHSGKLKSPQWCHRIFPIQETCVLSEAELHTTVSKLFLDFVKSKEDQDEPIKFAVGYNRRGIDETEMKGQKNGNEGSKQQTLMDRDQCFKVVAGAVKSVAENSIVDLRSPEHVYFWMQQMSVAVLVEMLPISGVSLGSSVAGVSVLPSELISTKPRLCVKALVPDAKAAKKK